MTKFYLVRHGESEWNHQKRVQGQQNTLLTEKGRLQAKKTASRLLNENIDAIYSSDLKRASETAGIIGNVLDLNVTPLKCLREIFFGPWEGQNFELLDKKYEEEHKLWLMEPHKFNIEGAETLYQLQKRAMSGINKILDKDIGKDILIVSHGATLKTIVLGLLDMELKYFNKLTLGNASISIIEFRDYNKVLKLFNDTSHLREELNE